MSLKIFVWCINLLLLVTEITLVLGEHEKVTNKRSATHLNTHSGSSLNNYYTANGYSNGYGSNNNILYANGYGTASHGKFGEYGLNNNYFSNHKTENNDLGNNIYHNGASFINSKLDDKTSFGVHAAENKEFFNSGLYNRQNILNSNQNHDFGNVYSLKNTANYGNLNGNYANKFGGYISGDSVGNVGNENLGYNSKTHTHSHHTITKKIFVPRPYPVTVTKQVPVPQPYPVEVPKPVPVHVQVKVPVEVPKPYPVTVTQKVPIYVEKPVYVTKNVPVEVPKPYPVYIPKPVPVEVKVPYSVEKNVYEKVPLYAKETVHHAGSYLDNCDFHKTAQSNAASSLFSNGHSISGIGHGVSQIHNFDSARHGTGSVINFDHNIGNANYHSKINHIGNQRLLTGIENVGQVNQGFNNLNRNGYGYGIRNSEHTISTGAHGSSNRNLGQVQTFSGTSGTYSGVYVPSRLGGLHGTGYNTHSKNWSW